MQTGPDTFEMEESLLVADDKGAVLQVDPDTFLAGCRIVAIQRACADGHAPHQDAAGAQQVITHLDCRPGQVGGHTAGGRGACLVGGLADAASGRHLCHIPYCT